LRGMNGHPAFWESLAIEKSHSLPNLPNDETTRKTL
jgi:hypothetical protein